MAARKVGGLILDVKGDFERHVRTILERHGRAEDYIEVGLESPYRYNPLHNELDAHALAFGIATLMTNLYGRGKEPFWQQASTNLVKFVILLHQVLDGYVTLVQIYEHVINPDKLKVRVGEGDERFAVQRRIYIERPALIPRALEGFAWQDEHAQKTSWTPWSLDVVARLRDARIDFTESVVPTLGGGGRPCRPVRRRQAMVR